MHSANIELSDSSLKDRSGKRIRRLDATTPMNRYPYPEKQSFMLCEARRQPFRKRQSGLLVRKKKKINEHAIIKRYLPGMAKIS